MCRTKSEMAKFAFNLGRASLWRWHVSRGGKSKTALRILTAALTRGKPRRDAEYMAVIFEC